ncbi:MAG: amidohydrolase [Bacteroidota bacterium]
MQDLTISLVQTELAWENVRANHSHFENILQPLCDKQDLVILPEMFTTGFTMNPAAVAEKMNGITFTWMQTQAQKLNSVLCGSIVIEENGKYFNRLLWVNPDSTFHFYDKRHLFRMAGEHKCYSDGKKKIFPEIKGWKILPLICYDLRFPVWSRNCFKNNAYDYDLLIYVANWPSVRVHAWSKLLLARALENISYVAGVNRVGHDGQGFEYNGESALVSPKGFVFSTFESGKASVETHSLSCEELKNLRTTFPVGLDADSFEII